jgi:RNA polymerase sigma factor (sigma-70 family)
MQEGALLHRAQAGENMRNEIVLYLQPRLAAMAARMYERLAHAMRRGNVVERDDLVNSANVAILDSYEIALTKENPFGYLCQAARISMLHYLNGRVGNLINTRSNERISVLSLDLPTEDGQTLADELACELRLTSHSEHQPLAQLLQAIEALPERQRTVIRHYYGFGQAPESLNQISKLFTASPRTGIARRHLHLALKTLHELLTFSTEPERESLRYCHTGGTR